MPAKIAVIALSTEKLRDSERTFEKGLLLDEFCGILFMPNNSNINQTGYIGIGVSFFSCLVKNCLATIKGYILLRAFP